MKKLSLVLVCITMGAMLYAQSGEDMVRNAIKKNPTNSWKSGDKQKGQWTTGNNIAAYLWADGTMYLGNFYGSSSHGYGIDIAPDGRHISNCPNAKYYVGNYSNDIKSGTGKCYDKSGKLIYDGNFKDGKPTGTYPSTNPSSAYKFQNIDLSGGDKYVGETKDGKFDGYGVYIWKDGDMWIGPWKNDARDGRGLYIASKGTIATGTWKGDKHTPDQVASNPPSSSSSSSGYASGGLGSNMMCFICGGTGRQSCAVCFGTGRTMVGMSYQLCFMCGGLGAKACGACLGKGFIAPPPVPVIPTPPPVVVTPPPSPDPFASSSYGSSGRTRTCDLCSGDGWLRETTGSVSNSTSTFICSFSGCNITSSHKHVICHRCNGSGSLNL